MTDEEVKNPTEHKRRVRYKGKYPRRFEEKYKELNPEKYSSTIEKVKSKGSTPAGMHIPIMVGEILDFLQIKPGMHGFDATLGYGGHTLEMLKKLDHQGLLIGGDADPLESAKTKERLAKLGYGEDCFQVRLMNFCQIDELVAEVGPFNFILADLGVSSMQIDNPERGFSYKTQGPLDLRFNPNKGISAADRLRSMSRDELEGMLRENSDEPYAAQLAEQITRDMWSGTVIDTTQALHAEVEKALAGEQMSKEERKEAIKKASARTFQALRIDVNNEYEVLYEFLEKLPQALVSGGRVAILTFHSGEDRLVKKAFKEYHRQGLYSEVARDVVRPSAEECSRNPRAHSTKLRWAVKA
jgi:16S rRNA (cytosine1402-N4)-methyltransferase